MLLLIGQPNQLAMHPYTEITAADIHDIKGQVSWYLSCLRFDLGLDGKEYINHGLITKEQLVQIRRFVLDQPRFPISMEPLPALLMPLIGMARFDVLQEKERKCTRNKTPAYQYSDLEWDRGWIDPYYN